MTGDDWIRVKADGDHRRHRHPHRAVSRVSRPICSRRCSAFSARCPGTSVVEESIFNARFSYVNELARMGADVKVAMENNTARRSRAASTLSGAPVEAPDIRAGAALVVAGLAARGETEIIGLEYIDRGYERLEEMLSELGGQVQRSSGVTPLVEPTGFFETSEYPRDFGDRHRRLSPDPRHEGVTVLDIGIDLGTANVLVYVKGKGHRFARAVRRREGHEHRPSAWPSAKKRGRCSARRRRNIQAIRPLRDGVIADFEVTEAMLSTSSRR